MQENMMMFLHKLKDGTKLEEMCLKVWCEEEKLKLCFFKAKNGMKFKIPEELLIKAGQHAAERGMTLEEYIEEFIYLMKQEQEKNEREVD